MTRSPGPLPQDASKMVEKLGPEAAHHPEMRDKTIAYTAAEDSLVMKLENVRRLKSQAYASGQPQQLPVRPKMPQAEGAPSDQTMAGTEPKKTLRRSEQTARPRRAELLEPGVVARSHSLIKRPFGVRDIFMPDHDLTKDTAETFVQQYVKMTEDAKVSQNDLVIEENEMEIEQEGCWMTLTEKHKVILESKAYDLRQDVADVEEALNEYVVEPSTQVDVMEVCCEKASLLVKTVEQMGGAGMRLRLRKDFNGCWRQFAAIARRCCVFQRRVELQPQYSI